MYSSYDRLIDLARRTGSKLIVHNPIECEDFVILDVDEYERLLDNEYARPYSPQEMSSDELLDQINRDIAVWQANREQEERREKERMLADEAFEEEFGDIPPPDDWYSARDLIEDRIGDRIGHRYYPWLDDDDDFYDDEDDFDLEDDLDWEDEHPSAHFARLGQVDFDEDFYDWEDDWDDPETSSGDVDDIPDFRPELESEGSEIADIPDFARDDFMPKTEEPKLQPVPFDPPMDIEDMDWEEEPLPEEEPVFYEEPV